RGDGTLLFADLLRLDGGDPEGLASVGLLGPYDVLAALYVISENNVVGLFVITWAIAAAIWRLGRIEERWGATGRAQGAGWAPYGGPLVGTRRRRAAGPAARRS